VHNVFAFVKLGIRPSLAASNGDGRR